MSDSLNREIKAARRSHRRFYETNPPEKPQAQATNENTDERITKRTHSVIFRRLSFFIHACAETDGKFMETRLCNFYQTNPLLGARRGERGKGCWGESGRCVQVRWSISRNERNQEIRGQKNSNSKEARMPENAYDYEGYAEITKRSQRPPSYGVPASAG
jgi:hypothetical protein